MDALASPRKPRSTWTRTVEVALRQRSLELHMVWRRTHNKDVWLHVVETATLRNET